MRIIAVINQKGGVGKTTTCVNIGHALALAGRKVVALDLDPQGHLGASLGYAEWAASGMDRVLLDDLPLLNVLLPARDGLALGPAGLRLGEVEHLSGGVERGRRLTRAIAAARMAGVEYLFIDCPPSSGLLAINALFAANEVLVPMPGDYLALHGLSQLMRLLHGVERIQKKQLSIWVALTRYHPRRRLVREVVDKLLNYFPDRVLATPVREAASLAEAPSFGKTIFEYRDAGHGADDYQQLANDLVERRTLQCPTNA